jgi:hypothetical protein
MRLLVTIAALFAFHFDASALPITLSYSGTFNSGFGSYASGPISRTLTIDADLAVDGDPNTQIGNYGNIGNSNFVTGGWPNRSYSSDQVYIVDAGAFSNDRLYAVDFESDSIDLGGGLSRYISEYVLIDAYFFPGTLNGDSLLQSFDDPIAFGSLSIARSDYIYSTVTGDVTYYENSWGNSYDGTIAVAVPEPATLLLLCGGLIGIALARRRRSINA